MNRRTFLSAAAAFAGCAAFTPSLNPIGSVFGVLFHDRWVWFYEFSEDRNGWCIGHIVGDDTARGHCRYKEMPDGSVLVDWLTIADPIGVDEFGAIENSHWQTVNEEPKCSCGSEALPSHECPFAAEIYNSDRLCNCCEGCKQQCAMDI